MDEDRDNRMDGHRTDKPGGRGSAVTPRQWVLAAPAAIGLALVLVLLIGAGPALAFSDVLPSHPYYDAIEHLADQDIVSGYPDGTYRPDNLSWRQHFTKMVILTFGLPVSEDDVCPFTDVMKGGPLTHYPDNYIAVAAAKGITRGVGATLFDPYGQVSRAQAVTMVVRGIQNLYPDALESVPPEFDSTWGGFSPDHAENARIAEYNSLLAGLGKDPAHPDGDLRKLDPWGAMPRGELAQLLDNVLLFLDGVPPPQPPPLQTAHDPDAAMGTAYGSCTGAACHQLNLLDEHLGRGLGCATCHNADARPEVTAAIAAYFDTGEKQGCFACHPTPHGDANHQAAESAPCTDCHLLSLPAEHARPTSSAAAAGCNACHPLSGGFTWNERCSACHTIHAASPSHAFTPAGCQGAGCHASDLVQIHSGTPGGCTTCHSTSQVPTDPACSACHGLSAGDHSHPDPAIVDPNIALSGNYTTGYPTGSYTVPCQKCHVPQLVNEHARPTSASAAAGCDNCHPSPRNTLNPWNTSCVQGGCHPTGSGSEQHGAMAGAHGNLPSQDNKCTGGGCHAAADLGQIHVNAASSAGAECLVCHTTSSVPNTKYCMDCHPGKVAPAGDRNGTVVEHGYSAAIHTSTVAGQALSGSMYPAPGTQYRFSYLNGLMTYGNWGGLVCGGCHNPELGPEHLGKSSSSSAAQGCGACHAQGGPVESLPPTGWDGSCTACHTSYHVQMQSKHSVSPSGCDGVDCHYGSWKHDYAANHNDAWWYQRNGIYPFSAYPAQPPNGCALSGCHRNATTVPTPRGCGEGSYCHPEHPPFAP